MSKNIHPNDLVFINYLSDKLNIENLTPDYQLLNNCLSKKNNYDTNNKLLTLFLKINENQSYKDFSLFIMKKLVFNFKNSKKVIDDFPSNFLNPKIISYLIQNKLFFKYENAHKSMFDILINDSQNIDFFNFSLNEEYIPYYIVIANKYIETLNSYLNAFNLSLIESKNINLYANYLKLISKLYDSILNYDNLNTLIDSHLPLFYQIIETNIELYNFNQTVKDSYKYTNFSNLLNDNDYNLILNDLENYINNIKYLFNCNCFFKEFQNCINYQYYLNHNYKYFNSLINLIPFFTLNDNNTLLENNTIYQNLYQNIISNFNNIFENTHVNIYNKIKFIKPGNYNIFNTVERLELLLIIYKELERFDENTGFLERNITRYNIIQIITKIDNIDLLKQIKKDVFDDFINLYISELNKLFDSVCEFKNKITISKLTRRINKLDKYKINLCINLDKLYNSYSILYYLINNNYYHNNSNFIKKIWDLLSYWIDNSSKNRLFVLCTICNNLEDDKLINSESKKIIQELYIQFFQNINDLIENNDFINYILENQYYYLEDSWNLTRELIGPLNINFKINEYISVEKIINKFQNIIHSKKNIDEIYNSEIPIEFLDPIMMIPIKEPLEIPETKYIVDKDTIMEYLSFNEINPFTRNELTKTDLEEYNNQNEVKERCIRFINEFNDWKNKNKIR